MNNIKYIFIDNVTEFYNYSKQIESFIESSSIRHTYKIHPLYIIEKFKYERINIILVYVDNVISAYLVFILAKSAFDLRFSVKKVFGLKVDQANYIGSIILPYLINNVPILTEIVNLVRQKNSKLRIIAFNEIKTDSDVYKLLINSRINNFALVNLSEKLEIETELLITSSFEDLLAKMKAKTRYTLNRNMKQFKDAAHDNSNCVKIDQQSSIASFYQDLDKIYKNTWQAATFGYRARNTDNEICLAQKAAEQGWFRSYLLYYNSSPIAFAVGYQYQGVFYLDEIGYDIKYKKLSPGNYLIYTSIEDIMTYDTPGAINFGYGENLYKSIYGNSEVSATNLLLLKTNSLVLLIAKLQLFINVIYRFIYKILKKYQLDSFFRKLLKHR